MKKSYTSIITIFLLIAFCSCGVTRNCKIRTDSYYGYSDKKRAHEANGEPVR